MKRVYTPGEMDISDWRQGCHPRENTTLQGSEPLVLRKMRHRERCETGKEHKDLDESVSEAFRGVQTRTLSEPGPVYHRHPGQLGPCSDRHRSERPVYHRHPGQLGPRSDRDRSERPVCTTIPPRRQGSDNLPVTVKRGTLKDSSSRPYSGGPVNKRAKTACTHTQAVGATASFARSYTHCHDKNENRLDPRGFRKSGGVLRVGPQGSGHLNRKNRFRNITEKDSGYHKSAPHRRRKSSSNSLRTRNQIETELLSSKDTSCKLEKPKHGQRSESWAVQTRAPGPKSSSDGSSTSSRSCNRDDSLRSSNRANNVYDNVSTDDNDVDEDIEEAEAEEKSEGPKLSDPTEGERTHTRGRTDENESEGTADEEEAEDPREGPRASGPTEGERTHMRGHTDENEQEGAADEEEAETDEPREGTRASDTTESERTHTRGLTNEQAGPADEEGDEAEADEACEGTTESKVSEIEQSHIPSDPRDDQFLNLMPPVCQEAEVAVKYINVQHEREIYQNTELYPSEYRHATNLQVCSSLDSTLVFDMFDNNPGSELPPDVYNSSTYQQHPEVGYECEPRFQMAQSLEHTVSNMNGMQQPSTSQCDTSHRAQFESSHSPVPTRPQSEAVVNPENHRTLPRESDSQGSSVSLTSVLAHVKELISCASCRNTFNRTVICHKYQIQLNRPIQSVCGCVMCSICYHRQQGCRVHKTLSRGGLVNATADALASCPELEMVGACDLELEPEDQFKTDEQINGYILGIMHREQAPCDQELENAYNQLIALRDCLSFQYWTNQTMPMQVAIRYVCIPHLPKFWDRILVGGRTLPNTENMICPDNYLPKLFNVLLSDLKFHWCCFVFKTEVILAMWCTREVSGMQTIVFPLFDYSLKALTGQIEFRSMVFYLSRWFSAQYVSQRDRELKVVLDCKPSEGTMVHVIASFASACGMERVTTHLKHKRSTINSQNLESAKNLLTSPYDGTGGGSNINIMAAINCFREPSEARECDWIRTYNDEEHVMGV